ncbi:MAG: translation elongation factor Ts [bacterium]
MAKIDFSLVEQLREKSGAGVILCKEALEDSDGDIKKAMDYIRKKGAAKFAKRAERNASEGVIGVYIHGVDQKTAALVELNCETDFVARGEDFRNLAHDLAMQVAAMSPEYVDRNSVPKEALEKERQLIKESDDLKGKPENMVDKIVEGKLEMFYEEKCLMDQKFFKDNDLKVQDLIHDAVAKIGEKIEVSRIYRMVVGG